MSMVADATNTRRMFGLGNTNQDATSTDIEFGLHLVDNGTLEVLESGTSRGSVGSYSVGDVLKVAIESNSVTYDRNGTLLYTSAGKLSYPSSCLTGILVAEGIPRQ